MIGTPTGSSEHRTRRILVVDDSRAIHADFRKILAHAEDSGFEEAEASFFGSSAAPSTRSSFSLDSAHQGEDALELVRASLEKEEPYALAFLDVRMPPGWDGIVTAEKLWEADPALEIVLCTAYSDYSWEAIAAKFGHRDNLVILKKPFDPCEVLQLAHALCRKWELKQEAGARLAHLEQMVQLRTEQLQQANVELRNDILNREVYESRLGAFCSLNHRLSAAKTIRQASEAIADATSEVIGWEACTFNLYSAREDKVCCIFAADTVGGQRTECQFSGNNLPPSPIERRALREGPVLIAKREADPFLPGALPFGSGRPSACIMLAPVLEAGEAVGVISVHSYTPDAYSEASLELLKKLAGHCGGALARLRAEEALRKTQERLSLLVRESPAVLYSATSEDAGAPDWVSENVQELFELSAAECCEPGRWARQVHPEDTSPFGPRSGAKAACEYRLRRPSGEYRWVRDQRRQIARADGRGTLIVGTWVDITAQKELEDQLRHAQKMEAVGQLAGGVAHDFNNLLAVILGNAELALGAPECSHSAEMIESLRQVIAASQKAANLTRQLLAFSRKQVLNMVPLDLGLLLADLAKMLRRIIGEHIELKCECAPGLPLVLADAGALEQVLMNLVVNARDAMPKGGVLTIGAMVRKHSGAETARPGRTGIFACLQVTDSGSGIAPEHLPHIFEPFYTTKEIGKGTGLGLATVHGLMQQHNGWVEVKSQPGQGSTFSLFLPEIAAAALQPGGKAVLPGARGTETILLVEDDEAVRKLTSKILQRAGFTIHQSTSGRHALDQWKNAADSFDLLLTDILMPGGVSGVDLAESLRESRPGLRVLYMSGYSGDQVGNLAAAPKSRRARLLRKPFQAADLVQAVRDTLDGVAHP